MMHGLNCGYLLSLLLHVLSPQIAEDTCYLVAKCLVSPVTNQCYIKCFKSFVCFHLSKLNQSIQEYIIYSPFCIHSLCMSSHLFFYLLGIFPDQN